MPQFLFRLPVRIYALAALAVGLAAVLTFVLLSRSVSNAYEMREKELIINCSSRKVVEIKNTGIQGV